MGYVYDKIKMINDAISERLHTSSRTSVASEFEICTAPLQVAFSTKRTYKTEAKTLQ